MIVAASRVLMATVLWVQRAACMTPLSFWLAIRDCNKTIAGVELQESVAIP